MGASAFRQRVAASSVRFGSEADLLSTETLINSALNADQSSAARAASSQSLRCTPLKTLRPANFDGWRARVGGLILAAALTRGRMHRFLIAFLLLAAPLVHADHVYKCEAWRVDTAAGECVHQ
jgi:hypothetical protein